MTSIRNMSPSEKYSTNTVDNCLSISANQKPFRGVSADTSKKTLKGLSQLTFNKLVAQTTKNTEKIDNNMLERKSERIHSQSTSKKIDQENTSLIPPQPASKAHKKTLVLDLDETLIHSGFRPFEGGNDIVLKVIFNF